MSRKLTEPGHSTTYKISCAPSEDSFATFTEYFVGSQEIQSVFTRTAKTLIRLCECVADLSFRWAHMQSCRKCRAPVQWYFTRREGEIETRRGMPSNRVFFFHFKKTIDNVSLKELRQTHLGNEMLTYDVTH